MALCLVLLTCTVLPYNVSPLRPHARPHAGVRQYRIRDSDL